MSGAVDKFRDAAIDQALRGPATSSVEARRAAFENTGLDERARALIDKVARHAWKVTPSDVAGAKAAGLSEDEIFELVVCAAYGQASRQLQSGLAALENAGGPEGPPLRAGGPEGPPLRTSELRTEGPPLRTREQ